MQEIRLPNTPFLRNQAWKHDFKHSSIPFSQKKHFFTHTCCRVERIQLKSTQLVMSTNCTSNVHLLQMINGFFC